MKKTYHAPVLHTQKLMLGVFGNYGEGGGEGGGGGGSVVPEPIKVVDRFEMHMD